MTWNEFSQSFKLFFKAVDSGYMIKRWNKIEIWSIVSAMNVQCMIYSTITLGPRQKGYWEKRICPYKISVYEHHSQTHKYVNTNANHRHSYTHHCLAEFSNYAEFCTFKYGSRRLKDLYGKCAFSRWLNLAYNADILSQSP